MGTRNLSASFVAGAGIALGVGIPAAQATAPTVHHVSVSTHMTKQAISALDARWNGEAAVYKTAQAQLAQARALKAVDARWKAEDSYYKSKLASFVALKAINARWIAEDSFYGLR